MSDIVHVSEPGTALSARPGPEQAADRIEQSLPRAVDRLTPGGVIPSGPIEDIIRQQKS
ncbi:MULTISPECIES: hypothetical protein [Streptomyces]|uniref:hypothetical protein n=1 Tax=Streptomyces TaxID=1883 RepID=UPI0029D023EB|nr:hypothetical protein [Streptomyces sp. F8]MDX6761291.1 hypothetical protein [Streptomyces sp. F8]